MNLLPDWRRILRHAWSIRLMLLAGLLSGCEAALPFFADSLPRGIFAGLSIVVAAGALVARVTVQKGIHGDDL